MTRCVAAPKRRRDPVHSACTSSLWLRCTQHMLTHPAREQDLIASYAAREKDESERIKNPNAQDRETQVGRGSQLQSLWIIPTAAVS